METHVAERLGPNFGDIKLIVLDLGGVLRDSAAALDYGYRIGFESEGLTYDFEAIDTWHLRGIGKYDIAIECIKVLLALHRRAECAWLTAIVRMPTAEGMLDQLVRSSSSCDFLAQAERIRVTYKRTFNSQRVASLITLYPFAERSVRLLKMKNYALGLLTNGNKVTVGRDVPFSDLFDAIMSEDDVREKKPSGEGLRRLMGQLGYGPTETLFVCDAPNDLAAARDGGVRSAAVLSGMGMDIHLACEDPDLLVEDVWSLATILPERRINS